MLEFHQESGAYVQGYGGDVFNTAVYAVRCGLDVSFFTAAGDDHYSRYLLNAWADEGVSTDTVRIIPSAKPSLYIIDTDDRGERSFHYWREASPFKAWLTPGAYVQGLVGMLQRHRCLYFTGVTLALLEPADRQRLLKLLRDYREGGGLVAFDPNYRPSLWQSGAEASRWVDEAYTISDFAFPSYDDEAALRGEGSEEMIARIAEMGVKELAVKRGASGITLVTSDYSLMVPGQVVDAVIDSTAAGDAFNAAYLAERLRDGDLTDAAVAGCKLAAKVIQHPGAIIPGDPESG